MKSSLESIEKLEKELSNAKVSLNEEKIKKTLDLLLSLYQKSDNYEKMKQTALELLPFYKKNGDKKGEAKKLLFIGQTSILIPDTDDAIKYSEEAIKIYSELNDEFGIANAYMCIGQSYRVMGKYDESLSYLFSAIEIYKKYRNQLDKPDKKKEKEYYGNTFESIGIIYAELNQLEKSREYFHKALSIYEEINELYGVSKILNNLGVSFSKEDSFKTLEYYKKALKIVEKLDIKSMIAVYTNNIGGVYEDIGEYDEALQYYEKALNYSKENNLIKYKAFFLKHIGSVYMKKEKYNTAIQYLNESLSLSKELKMQSEIQDNFYLLSDIYKRKEDFQTALDYHEKYAEQKDKILNQEIIGKISSLQKKHEKTHQKLLELKKHDSLISETLKKSMKLNLIGSSKKIKKVLELAMTAAANKDTNVLITGESGTGKEIIAQIIHYASSRKDQLFVAVNSSSVPESLAESEFFGHIKGAFTGAINDKTGFLEEANKGTLFLDEIADTPPQLQAKFLRVLENKKIKHIGSNKEIQVDFRIIAATNKNIDELIENNIFRADLLYRINTIEINIPPLRERPADIKPLLNFFVQEFSKSLNKPMPKINSAVVDKLKKYHFPGNVRELKNMVEKAMILLKSDSLEPEHFDTGTINNLETNSVEIIKYKTIDKMEKQMIIDALKETNNNRTRAARLLGISHSTLLRKLKKMEK